MVELFLNVIAPVFVIAGLGWGWNRLNIHYDAKTITLLVMNIGVPSLVFSTISSLSVSKEVLGQVGLAAVAALTTMAVIAFVVLKVTRRPVQSFLPPLMFGNVGNIGLPVCFFAFGEAGLTYATIVFAVYALSMMTIGPWIYSGIKNPAHLARSPILYAVICSLVFLTLGEQPPDLVLKTTRLLGQFTIPLMLFTLGISLGNLNVDSLFRAVFTSTLRIGLGFGVGVLIADIFGLTGIAKGVLILQSSMPVAVFNYLLAKQYEKNSKQVAELVFVSTLMSLITLPLILNFLA